MARARSGNSSAGLAWALVIFVAAFLVSAILAIVFYTRASDRDEKLTKAQSSMAQFVDDPGDLKFPTVQQAQEKARNTADTTVLRAMVDQITAMDAQLKQAQQKLADQSQELTSKDTTITAKDTLNANTQAKLADQLAAAAEKDLTWESARAAMEAQVTSATNTIAQLNQRIASMDDTATAYSLDVRAEREVVINELRDQKTQLESTVATLNAQNAELQQKFKAAQPANVTVPDATVTALLPGSRDIVLMDIGRRQGVQLAMTFEVFEPDTAIKLQGDALPRGKATIEVVGLDDDAAKCRVVRRTGVRDGVAVGDKAYNVAFDPNSPRRFAIRGRFDVDRDGFPDPDFGVPTMERLVRRSGGTVVPDIGVETDYLILGEEAPIANEPPAGADAAQVKDYLEALKRFNEYRSWVAEAERFSIPILNQNRMLDLVGYYDRTPVN